MSQQQPFIQELRKRKANHSALMLAKKAARKTGEVVNACPYCKPTDDDPGHPEFLDEHGYCYHLVGFTIPGSSKIMEPLGAPDEKTGRRHVKGKKEYVQKGDKLERITTCSRVYRNIPMPEWARPVEELLDDEPAEEVIEAPKRKKKQPAEV